MLKHVAGVEAAREGGLVINLPSKSRQKVVVLFHIASWKAILQEFKVSNSLSTYVDPSLEIGGPASLGTRPSYFCNQGQSDSGAKCEHRV